MSTYSTTCGRCFDPIPPGATLPTGERMPVHPECVEADKPAKPSGRMVGTERGA